MKKVKTNKEKLKSIREKEMSYISIRNNRIDSNLKKAYTLLNLGRKLFKKQKLETLIC